MKKQTNEEIEQLKQQIEEWKGKYLRALADYQNLERRTNEEWLDKQVRASVVVISKMLPVYDTLKKAADHIQNPGLNLGIKSLSDTLTELGVQSFETVGLPFDPATMDCIDVIEGEEGKVLEELLPGYIYKGMVLRPAKVKVGKTKSD